MSQLPVVTLAEMLENPDRALKRAREAGVMVQTEIGPVVVRHDAVRQLGQSEKLRPVFSKSLDHFGSLRGRSTTS